MDKNIQDNFLLDIIKSNEVVEISFTNGLILKGKIVKFDNFSILIEYSNKKTLIYKHSISYIFAKGNKKS